MNLVRTRANPKFPKPDGGGQRWMAWWGGSPRAKKENKSNYPRIYTGLDEASFLRAGGGRDSEASQRSLNQKYFHDSPGDMEMKAIGTALRNKALMSQEWQSFSKDFYLGKKDGKCQRGVKFFQVAKM